MNKDSIILIGMAGVGKSTLGRLLAQNLGSTFTDLDEYLRGRDGRTVQEIIDNEGEEALLNLEKQSMGALEMGHSVVAPGGSIIYHPDLMASLRTRATIIYLKDDLQSIADRLEGANTRGIVGLKNKPLRQIHEEREPLYARYADIIIDCHGKSADQVVKEIQTRLKIPPISPDMPTDC